MRRKLNFNILIIFLLVIVIIFSLFYGAVRVPILEVIKILLNKIGITNYEITRKSFISIVYYVRFPRIMTAVIVGGALAVCGCTMQSLLKNPIADSGIIGISSGASLGAVISIALGLSSKYIFAMPLFSIFFSLLISAIVYRLSTLRGKSDNLLLILSGIAISSFVGAISSIILTNLMESQIKEYIFWSIGSLSGRRWEHFLFGIGPIIFLSFILFYHGKELNILLLGDEEAKSLGINIRKMRKKILVIVAVLTAVSVCISGNIGFVGLVVPHILRKIIGADNRKLLKGSFLAGAFFLTLSDLISRVILAPSEISVGIITSLIGAPYFIYLIIKIRKEGKGL
ncbi:iron ABC transporter permease [Fusobacterium varium]|uniref:Iron ABC transporter permease n=1 Tax=Fusobacterium varium ATCC 27725 TaxID=469618 RepID=A0ABN5JN08_FUSVA|nr:iron ABC transporter permease [Fusobacterium varium]AVQ32547.1 iron ABC transporter permease [Fusobacterium varium ATCC 27725]MCF0169508.1 iron ABC transporter permease [Fusobacterium varium]MCF2672098.1 iron ABC transporter permease [Fusobacterium varium]RHG37148.1 iron ABC transporter permease [Fusobacterium varium]